LEIVLAADALASYAKVVCFYFYMKSVRILPFGRLIARFGTAYARIVQRGLAFNQEGVELTPAFCLAGNGTISNG